MRTLKPRMTHGPWTRTVGGWVLEVKGVTYRAERKSSGHWRCHRIPLREGDMVYASKSLRNLETLLQS